MSTGWYGDNMTHTPDMPTDGSTYTDPMPCRRCSDDIRFVDGDDTVCATCGRTRYNAARQVTA